MIKKKNEDSTLFNFKRSSYSEKISELADRLIKEFDPEQKHYDRKKKMLVTLIENLVRNFNRGFNTAIPRAKPFYSNRNPRYKPKTMSYSILIGFTDLMKKDEKYIIEQY